MSSNRVVDSLGLVIEGEHLVTFIPATGKAFVFRIVSRVNKGFEKLHYGPLPLPANTPLSLYGGGAIAVPADGVIPMFSYIPSPGISFPSPPFLDTFDKTDMWFIPTEWRDTLFHVITDVTPSFLRIDVLIPRGVIQNRFQKGKALIGIDKTMGFNRGSIEIIHFPGIYYGYRFGNDTNLNLYSSVDFTYAEYNIEIPKSPELIFDILTKRTHSKWITMPINNYDESIKRAFIDAYGFEGFPLYSINRREDALKVYRDILKVVKI